MGTRLETETRACKHFRAVWKLGDEEREVNTKASSRKYDMRLEPHRANRQVQVRILNSFDVLFIDSFLV